MIPHVKENQRVLGNKTALLRHASSAVDLRADRRFQVEVGGVLQADGMATDIFVVRVLDVSRSGFRVSCPVPVRAGSRITLVSCNTTTSGEVRYCQQAGPDEFLFGIKTENGAVDLGYFLEAIMQCL